MRRPTTLAEADGGNPVARALRRQHLRLDHSALLDRASRATTLFSKVARGRIECRVAHLLRRPERRLDLAHAVDEPRELVRLERRVVVGAVEPPASVKCFSTTTAPSATAAIEV